MSGYLEPVKRAKDRTDVRGTGHGSFNNGMCQRVMDLYDSRQVISDLGRL